MSEKIMIDPSSDDFGEMMNWALRYAIRRGTYAFFDTINYIRPLIPYLTSKTLACMQLDVESEVQFAEKNDIAFLSTEDYKSCQHFLDLIRFERQKRKGNKECEK